MKTKINTEFVQFEALDTTTDEQIVSAVNRLPYVHPLKSSLGMIYF